MREVRDERMNEEGREEDREWTKKKGREEGVG